MNKIIVTGPTGSSGGGLSANCSPSGYRVTGVTRSAGGRARLDSLGASAVEADVFDEASLRSAFDGADAVVNRVRVLGRRGTAGSRRMRRSPAAAG